METDITVNCAGLAHLCMHAAVVVHVTLSDLETSHRTWQLESSNEVPSQVDQLTDRNCTFTLKNVKNMCY